MNRKDGIMLQYGGALFSEKCPKCSKKVRPSKDLSVNTFITRMNRGETPTVTGKCPKHGFVSVPFVGFC